MPVLATGIFVFNENKRISIQGNKNIL